MDTNAADFIGSIPEFYDRGLGPVIFADYSIDMADRVAAVKPATVLETAAGTGILTRELRNRLPSATRLVATDLNVPMLDISRPKFARGERVEFTPADAQDLQFADNSFDALVCQFGIMFYPDRPKSFREALRVLKPGGRYFFSVWDSHRYNSFARVTDGMIRQLFPTDPPSFYRVPFSCAEIDPIKEAVLEAGFTDLEIDVLQIDKAIADLGLFVRGLIFGNPLIDQIRARLSVPPEEVYAATLEAVSRELGNPPVAPLQTIVYCARKPGGR